jgi:hypothetical protein
MHCQICLSPSIIPIAEIKEEPELNIDSEWSVQNEAKCDADVPEPEINTESVPFQIIHPVHELKEEPELQIDDVGVSGDLTG